MSKSDLARCDQEVAFFMAGDPRFPHEKAAMYMLGLTDWLWERELIEKEMSMTMTTDETISERLKDGDPLTDIVNARTDNMNLSVSRPYRRFETGATRDTDEGKPRHCGFHSPLVFQAYGEYMHRHRRLLDGTMRDADNWKKGMPPRECLESLMRHVHDLWLLDEGYSDLARESEEDALCAIIFNAQVRLHGLLVRKRGSKS